MTLHKELTEVARGLRQLVAFTRNPGTHAAPPPPRPSLGAAAAAEPVVEHNQGRPDGGRGRNAPSHTAPTEAAAALLAREAAAAAASLALAATAKADAGLTAARHAALCDGLSTCKGALAALLDARQVSSRRHFVNS